MSGVKRIINANLNESIKGKKGKAFVKAVQKAFSPDEIVKAGKKGKK